MSGLAVVSKGLLGEAFGITRLLCPLRPRIAVRMERDALTRVPHEIWRD
jgi:hypothetical protein